jgi:hypothetical protein
MCNLYSITRTQEAMRRLFRVKRDFLGNLPSLPGVFPDSMAPVVRTASDGQRELALMRWGFPPPPNLGPAPALMKLHHGRVVSAKASADRTEDHVCNSMQGSLVQLVERTIHQTREVAFDEEILPDEKSHQVSDGAPTERNK